jgi:hypothetical protein
MVIEGSDQMREPLPRERRIKNIFDEANRLLLILGEHRDRDGGSSV